MDLNRLPGETLVGRRNGLIAKEYFKLDELFASKEQISISIPNRFKAITSSFFLGMFESYILKLNCDKSQFYERFHFAAPERLRRQIDTGLQDAIEANHA
ncbi:hypothetical protein [Idiomarina sp.]|uniref:hypothetical protein n=1 Tax=Idiomarina sp. TaxID=1874361 RepID=UPI0025C5864A|nr:hypothetical protein [Idiomarina sp.]